MQGFATKYIIQCAHPLSPQNGNRLWKQVLILLVACCFAMNKHLHPPRASLTPNKPQPTGMVSIIRAHSDMRAKSKKRLLQHLSLLKFSWAKAIALWFLDLISINYLKCQVILAGSFHLNPLSSRLAGSSGIAAAWFCQTLSMFSPQNGDRCGFQPLPVSS